MAKIFIINHLTDTVSNATAILVPEVEIKSGVNYKISPIEVGFDYTKSLLEKFDEVEFVTNHTNYPVLLQQSELEIAHKHITTAHTKKVLDTNTLNFFGCSHTYGTGHRTLTSYPAVLSSLLAINYNNFGLPGRGNYDIEDLLTTYSIKNAKLIIQFTDMYRVRYLSNGNLIQDGVYNINHSHSVLFSEENLFFNFKKIVDRLVTRLREGNNQFVITYTNNIDNKWAVDANMFLHGYAEYCSAIGTQVDTALDGLHYGVTSHNLWANRLFNKWESLYGN